MQILTQVLDKFKTHFHSEPYLFCSPGRVNLIGEHTDYNNGLVLPAAIDKYIYLAIGKRSDQEIHLYSLDYQELFISSITSLESSGKLWPDYHLGVFDHIMKSGADLKGVNIVFGGDIPQGAGLSSSAALECAIAFALNHIFDLGYNELDIAKIGQAAENNFVGVQCGLMDQFASVFGKKNNLIKLDCETLQYSYIPFDIPGYSVVLFDTQVKHSLASSAYNERRRECEYGVKLIQRYHPLVLSLRQVTQEMLERYVKGVNPLVYQRCNFVVSEIQRLGEACDDLVSKNFQGFGKRMFETHEGLRNRYEVSCPELDFLVDYVENSPQVLGARMMGGGFGGCTINIIKTESIDKITKEIAKAYHEFTQKEMKVYRVLIEDGTRLISEPVQQFNNSPVT